MWMKPAAAYLVAQLPLPNAPLRGHPSGPSRLAGARVVQVHLARPRPLEEGGELGATPGWLTLRIASTIGGSTIPAQAAALPPTANVQRNDRAEHRHESTTAGEDALGAYYLLIREWRFCWKFAGFSPPFFWSR